MKTYPSNQRRRLTAALAIILLAAGWTGIHALAADPATVNLTTGRGRLFVSSFMTMHDPFFMDLEKAYDYLAGKKVEKDIRVPVKLVTKANADQFLK